MSVAPGRVELEHNTEFNRDFCHQSVHMAELQSGPEASRREVRYMPTGAVMVPGDLPGALAMLDGALGFLADMDAAGTPAAVLAVGLRALEQADAVGAAARGRMLAAF